MSQETIVFPDSVALVIDFLKDEVGGTVLNKVSDPRLPQFVVVRRVGGVRRNIVCDAATLTVDCWAEQSEDAHDLAQYCRAVLHTLPGQQLDGVTVYKVDEVGGPADLPDPVSDQPRYSFTVSVTVRGSVSAS
jgi:hypothetical protein